MSDIRQHQAEALRDVAAIAVDRFGAGQTNRIQYQNWILHRENAQVQVTTLDQEPVLTTQADGSIHRYDHYLAKNGELTQELRGHIAHDVARTFLQRTGQTDFTSEKYGYQLQTNGSRLAIHDASDRPLLLSQVDPTGQTTLLKNQIDQVDVERFHALGQAVQQMEQRQQPQRADSIAMEQ
ncbi:MAG: hypothetical protein AAFY26_00745 [Cyanobacteria bacterium J06638_22]